MLSMYYVGTLSRISKLMHRVNILTSYSRYTKVIFYMKICLDYTQIPSSDYYIITVSTNEVQADLLIFKVGYTRLIFY